MQVYSSSPLNKLMPKGNPLSIEIVEEAEGRFMIRTYADGEVVREPVVPKEHRLRRHATPYPPQRSLKPDPGQ